MKMASTERARVTRESLKIPTLAQVCDAWAKIGATEIAKDPLTKGSEADARHYFQGIVIGCLDSRSAGIKPSKGEATALKLTRTWLEFSRWDVAAAMRAMLEGKR